MSGKRTAEDEIRAGIEPAEARRQAPNGSGGVEPHGERWLVLSVQAPPRGEEPLLVDALRRLGARLVEQEGERFVAHLPPPDDVDSLLRDAEVVVRASTGIVAPAFAWRWGTRDELAGRWRRDVAPRRITDRIVVVPADSEPEPRCHDLIVRLNPGFGFGTAEHATTRMCLRFLEDAVRPDDRIADVGSGSGILAIAAALLGAGRVLAFEADPIACETARENVAGNRADDRVAVLHREIDAGSLATSGPFDGIVANLEAPILFPLVPGIERAVEPGGWVILSGASRPEGADLVRTAADLGLAVRDEAAEDGWWAGFFRRERGRTG